MEKYLEVELSKISPFPINADIYGDTDPSNLKTDEQKLEFAKLVESIELNGLLQPVVIDQNYTLISGERRFAAHKFLGKDKIKAVMLHYKDDYQRTRHLLEENLYRNKTIMQKIREGEVREQLLLEKKKEILAETGKETIRDVVGGELGMSGKTFKMGQQVLDKIKELEEEGKTEEAEELEIAANKSVSGALKKINEKPTKEETNEDYLFWYKNRLSSLISIMKSTTTFIKKYSKSNESKYFLDFVDRVELDINEYQTWVDVPFDCPLCLGKGCKACKEGKVGHIRKD